MTQNADANAISWGCLGHVARSPVKGKVTFSYFTTRWTSTDNQLPWDCVQTFREESVSLAVTGLKLPRNISILHSGLYKKILPVVWIITLNLNCYTFPHKNAGTFNGFSRDEVIKGAGADARTARAGAPTNKPSTPDFRLNTLLVHSAAAAWNVASSSILMKKISGREQNVGRLDQIVRGQRKKSWRERPFHQSLGSVYRYLLVT